LDDKPRLFRVIIIDPKKEPKVVDMPITYSSLCKILGRSYGACRLNHPLANCDNYKVYYRYGSLDLNLESLDSPAIIIKQPRFCNVTSLNCNDITLIMKYIEDGKQRLTTPVRPVSF